MHMHEARGKFTYCLAEDEEGSPFPPLHQSLVIRLVTILGAEAPVFGDFCTGQ